MAKSNRSGVWQRTMVIVGFVLVLGFGAVITNLVRLQLVNGETLKTDAGRPEFAIHAAYAPRAAPFTTPRAQGLGAERQRVDGRLEPNYIDEGDDVKIAKRAFPKF